MRVGVTGPNGRLASYLIAHHGCVPLECNIEKFDETRIEIQRVEPDVIINCAAYTRVDGAEKEMQESLLANVRGAGNVRMAFDNRLVHLSTSYIFSGRGSGPYTESDEASPINQYGWTKWGGEAAVLSGGSDNCLIVRTVSLYGSGPKPDFVSTLLDGFRDNRAAILPNKLISNPTYVPHLAKALMWCIEQDIVGTLNIAGKDIVSRYKWAQQVAKTFKFKQSLVGPKTFSLGAALRPRNASLDLSKAKSMGVPLYSLKKGLKELKKWEGQSSISRQ